MIIDCLSSRLDHVFCGSDRRVSISHWGFLVITEGDVDSGVMVLVTFAETKVTPVRGGQNSSRDSDIIKYPLIPAFSRREKGKN